MPSGSENVAVRAVPDVEDEEAVTVAITKAAALAARSNDAMRCTEGEKLAEDLKMRGQLVREIVRTIEQRAPLVLHYLEGFSLEEIARVQRVPLGTVKYRLHQARKALRVEMNGKEGEP